MDVAEVLDRIRSIPRGRVAAYGDVTPGAPRHAGRVLSECHEPDVPWAEHETEEERCHEGERAS